jgi:cephalosporin hydroxylase
MLSDTVAVHIDIAASVQAMAQGCILFDVPAMKGIEDLHRYTAAINATQPDLIIQTGTAVGGSAMWLAHNWVLYGGPQVVTIDVDRERVDRRVVDDERITVLTGSSTDPQVVEEVRTLAESYSRVMVILDSDHSRDHVVQEIDTYGPMVTSGCYLVVEDGIYDFAGPGEFCPGPFSAIKERLVGNSEWRRDVQIEALEQISMYPAGWWIKK